MSTRTVTLDDRERTLLLWLAREAQTRMEQIRTLTRPESPQEDEARRGLELIQGIKDKLI